MAGLNASKHESSALHGFYSWTDTLKSIYYGSGSVNTALPSLLNTLGAKKALIVTGNTLYQQVKKVEDILKQQNAYGASFHDIGAHVPIAGIRKGMQAFKDAQADIIVSVGGGSPIDASKAIIYNLQKETGGTFPLHIAIPTTLSAAEYSIGAGYTNDEGTKVAVSSQELAPSGIILDAELTLDTPEKLWLSTGIRALDHAVETLYRPSVPPPVKVLCYAAIADLFKYLPLSKADPKAVDVRQKLQLASWMSLWPLKMHIYSALGLSHSIGHKLGAAYGIPHGITSCLTLAPVVRMKAEVASHEDKQNLADALTHIHVPSTGSVEDDVRSLAVHIEELVHALGLKSTLGEYGVPTADFQKIAEKAVGDKDSLAVERVVKILEDLH